MICIDLIIDLSTIYSLLGRFLGNRGLFFAKQLCEGDVILDAIGGLVAGARKIVLTDWPDQLIRTPPRENFLDHTDRSDASPAAQTGLGTDPAVSSNL